MRPYFALLLIVFLTLPSVLFSQNESAKARFIQDLTKPIYIYWPSRVTSLDIAIVKNQELHDELQSAVNSSLAVFAKTVNIQVYNHPNEIKEANIIYIHHKDFPNIDALIEKFQKEDCLVIGENYPFRTSMINIIERNDETYYEINEDLIGSESIKLRRLFLKKRSNSERQWAELLKSAEQEIDQKKQTIKVKDQTIAKKQVELSETSDSLRKTEENLEITSEQLEVTSDSLTYSQLVVQQKADRLEYEQKLRVVFIILILLSISIVFFIYNIYRTKRKHAERLAILNEKITHQNVLLESRNKEILDSIRYAQRIQEALLPTNKIVRKHLDESFVIFKPKDIVSGDFYWMETIDNKVLYAAVDCTGHGVPGAFVSIVGYDGLNRALREFNLTEPAKIMDKLNEFVDETFEKGEEEIKDGMDMALCCLDFNKKTLEYSGANNPLWLIREKKNGKLSVNGKEIEPVIDSPSHMLFEIRADKQPIGKFSGRHPFSNHLMLYKPGDTFYTFSDGYADQFGGPKGKKFKYRPFKELLLGIQHKPMQEQRTIIHDTFEAWKNENTLGAEGFEQIDDVVVIGVRI